MFNKPSYNGVDPNADTKILVSSLTEPVFVLSQKTTAEELKQYVRNGDIASYERQTDE